MPAGVFKLKEMKQHPSVINMPDIIVLYAPMNGSESFSFLLCVLMMIADLSLTLHTYIFLWQVEKWNEQRENGTFAGPL